MDQWQQRDPSQILDGLCVCVCVCVCVESSEHSKLDSSWPALGLRKEKAPQTAEMSLELPVPSLYLNRFFFWGYSGKGKWFVSQRDHRSVVFRMKGVTGKLARLRKGDCFLGLRLVSSISGSQSGAVLSPQGVCGNVLCLVWENQLLKTFVFILLVGMQTSTAAMENSMEIS